MSSTPGSVAKNIVLVNGGFDGSGWRRCTRWLAARRGKGIVLATVLTFSGPLNASFHDGSSHLLAQTQAKLEATVFSYDGQDFVRTKTTLLTAEGKPAVNTKLEHDSPAYKALVQKRSYTGDATVFGRKFDVNYAPLTSSDGRLTGAVFVGVAK